MPLREHLTNIADRAAPGTSSRSPTSPPAEILRRYRPAGDDDIEASGFGTATAGRRSALRAR